MKLAGRIAPTVVTGAHRGIGRASAEALAAEGAEVVAADVIAEAGLSVSMIHYRRLDVSSPEAWDKLAAELARVDILVNAAGITQTRSGLPDLDLAEWHRIIAVNQTGTMLGMRMAVTMMLKGPCSIVDIIHLGLCRGLRPAQRITRARGPFR